MDRERVLFVRWGGSVAIDISEVSSANSATLDYFLVRKLTELGCTVDLCMTSKTTADLVNSNARNFYKDVNIVDVPYDTSIYNYVFVLQGTTNYRFGGWKDIPSQVLTYRIIRDCKCPIIYVQYDANTQIDLPPVSRGIDNSYYGCTVEEFVNSNFNLLSVGRNMEYYRNHGYNAVFDVINKHYWKYDLHSISIPMISEMSLEPKEDVRDVISFVGKDRNIGSKRGTISNIGNVLVDAGMSNYEVDVYGDWKKFVEEKNQKSLRVDNTNFKGPIKGLDNVLNVYNNSKFAILACNEFNLELQQYTIRTFEVIAGGAVPITDIRWFNQWRDIFTENVQVKLEKLCFNTMDEIPSIIKQFDIDYPTSKDRCEFIKEIRKSITSVITDEYVTNELWNTLQNVKKIEEKPHSDLVFNNMINLRKASKLKRIKNTAEEDVQKIKETEQEMMSNPDAYYDKYIKGCRNSYFFSLTKMSDEEIEKRFTRSK